MKTVAIIGSGISGLTAARILKDHCDVTLFEKSRSVGGRMATRRAEPYLFDHGTQFFKARESAFCDFIAPMIEAGVIQRWDARFVEFANKTISHERQWDQAYPHYVGAPNMNAIGKYLSQGLTITFDTRVGSLEHSEEQWHIRDDQGNFLGKYDWVVSTIPAQQASQLIPPWLRDYPKVSTIKMKACFSLMLGFKNKVALEFDAALVRGEDISWISVNSSKPQREKTFCLLIHSSNTWADAHINDNPEEVIEYLCEKTSEIIGYNLTNADHKAIHGWRFANIEKQKGETHLVDNNYHIGICGDWLIQGRVEAAFISGFAMANAMVKSLNMASLG